MNQKELSSLSALVERRMALRAMLKEWESGEASAPTAEQRRAIRQLIEERAEDYLRLDEAVRRLSDQLDKLEARMSEAHADEASTARVRKLQRDLRVVGEDVRRMSGSFLSAGPAEVYTASLVDPYMDDSAPVAQRVRVPEGDL
jgi:predicted nuclease with TOPRIM domain